VNAGGLTFALSGFDLGTPGGTSGGPFVQGINEGVVGMRVGGQRRLLVPPKLAYGDQQVQEIPPNATLDFEIELLSIKKDLPKPTLFRKVETKYEARCGTRASVYESRATRARASVCHTCKTTGQHGLVNQNVSSPGYVITRVRKRADRSLSRTQAHCVCLSDGRRS